MATIRTTQKADDASANSQGPPDRETMARYSQYRHQDADDITKVH
jgi:hypothetical protein